jgi:hypothetical protein
MRAKDSPTSEEFPVTSSSLSSAASSPAFVCMTQSECDMISKGTAHESQGSSYIRGISRNVFIPVFRSIFVSVRLHDTIRDGTVRESKDCTSWSSSLALCCAIQLVMEPETM